jgi:HSP20 family protein
MELVRWQPFPSLGHMHSLFSDLLDDNFGRPWMQSDSTKGYPVVDVLESKDVYLIRAELPGMKREDFNLEVKDGTLTLSGERKVEKPAEGVEYRHVERVNTKFWRSFDLPEAVKHEAIDATYKDGVLEVRIPKAEELKPRQIEINVQ